MFGVTNEGFVRKRLADIRIEIEETLRTRLGNQINLLPESVFGQLVGIVSERESLIWELAEDTFNSAFPDTAFGAALDNVVAITGQVRMQAQPSEQIDLRLFGTALSVIPAGTQFQVQGNPNAIFQLDEDITLQGGQDAQDTINFSAVPDSGDFRLNFRGTDTIDIPFSATNIDIQSALTALPFGTGIMVTGDFSTGFVVDYTDEAGLQSQPVITVDNNTLSNTSVAIDVTSLQTQVGINQAVATVTAIEDGPIIGPAGTLNTILTPVAGLDSVINVTDVSIGRLTETDNELRLRRAETLQTAGASTPEAIVARIRSLNGVEDVFIFENQNNVPDTDGRPPHSFELVVSGGAEQEIIQLLWEVKPAGIKTVGQITGTATDSTGQPQTIRFSRPTEVEIFLEVDLTIDTTIFPANGLAAAEQAFVTQGNSFGIGRDVIVTPALICALNNIPGILGIDVRIGTSAGPTLDDNIPIAINEIPVFDSSRTTVVAI